jgi:hypothetical protein
VEKDRPDTNFQRECERRVDARVVCLNEMYWVFMNSVYAVYGLVYNASNASNAVMKYEKGLVV